MEYHWIEWEDYDSVEQKSRRKCVILEKEVVFDEQKIKLSNITISEFAVYGLSDIQKQNVESWIKKWKERGGKWKWYDRPKPDIKILDNDELLLQIETLFTNEPNHEKGFYSYYGIGILKSKFTEEEFQKMIPKSALRTFREYDITDTKWRKLPTHDSSKRQGFLGFIVDDNLEMTHYPVLFNFDEFAHTHMFLSGMTGSGKSITGFDIAEEALDNSIPVLVLDYYGTWTGFLEPCNDKNLLKNYFVFGMGKPKSYEGAIYTPSSDVGKPLNMNLLAKPPTDDQSKLQQFAIEASLIIQQFCDLTKDERLAVRACIFEKWKEGQDLNYKTIADVVGNDKTKMRLEELLAVSYLFEGERPKINDLWKDGEISVISFDEMRSEKAEMFTAYYVLRELVNWSDSLPDSPNKINLLVVVEEAHKFTEKNVWAMMDTAVKTLRKKGIGLLFITTGITDLEGIRGNTNFKTYMKTEYDNDIDRIGRDIGDYKSLMKILPAGMGIIKYPDFGIPVITQFRPCYHRPTKLTTEEIREKTHNE